MTRAASNDVLPIGTWVRCWPGTREGRYVLGRVIAEPVGGIARVEFVLGGSDYIALSHIERVQPSAGPVASK